MYTRISPLADVDACAQIGNGVEIGPFCRIGSNVTIGDGTRLDSHVAIVGNVVIGEHNHFFPGTVIGGEPQDVAYHDSDTRVEIGDNNIFREGVTVSRGAEKEDHTTRIGHRNMFMANSHIAHNCRIYNNVILVNGVLLGGHVHVHDGAIVSGNSVVHHFSTLGTLSFVSGGCRAPHDIPPYMLASGSDNPTIKTINLVGMQRAGISETSIRVIKRAHRLLYRDHKTLEAVREIIGNELDGIIPYELTALLSFVERQQMGRMGRAREVVRGQSAPPADGETNVQRRRAA